MNTKPSLVFIGAGNIASHLAPVLYAKGYPITQVVDTSLSAAESLSQKVRASYTDDIYSIDTQADVYFLCVQDDVILELSKSLRLPGKKIIHVSGSVAMECLTSISENVGVLYFLYAFSKKINIDFTKIPLCLEVAKAEDVLFFRKIGEDIEYKTLLKLETKTAIRCNFARS